MVSPATASGANSGRHPSTSTSSSPSMAAAYGFDPAPAPPLGILMRCVSGTSAAHASPLPPSPSSPYSVFLKPGHMSHSSMPAPLSFSPLASAFGGSEGIAPLAGTRPHLSLPPPQLLPEPAAFSTSHLIACAPNCLGHVSYPAPDSSVAASRDTAFLAPTLNPKPARDTMAHQPASSSLSSSMPPIHASRSGFDSPTLPVHQAWKTFDTALGAIRGAAGRNIDFSSAAYPKSTEHSRRNSASSTTGGAQGSPRCAQAASTTTQTSLPPIDPYKYKTSPVLGAFPMSTDSLAYPTERSYPLNPCSSSELNGYQPHPIPNFATDVRQSEVYSASSTQRTHSDIPHSLSQGFDAALPGHAPASPTLCQKRKRTSLLGEDVARHHRTREYPEVLLLESMRCSSSTVALTPPSRFPLTTITCLHASVGQKSYGNEKRFLNPPPMVRVTGPLHRLSGYPRLVVEVVSDNGIYCSREHSAIESEDGTTADPDARYYLRSLHIGKAGKAKTFRLELSLHPCDRPAPPKPLSQNGSVRKAEPMETMETLNEALASFSSAEMQIISKPSKKTVRARNTGSCLFTESTVALFNRINAQTVRTTFAVTEEGRLSSRAYQWTAFKIHVTKRAEGGKDADQDVGETFLRNQADGGPEAVTYGSEIVLTDLMTGVTSEPMIVRKVEKGHVFLGARGPVAQLQKLALARVNDCGYSIYLSPSSDGINKDGLSQHSESYTYGTEHDPDGYPSDDDSAGAKKFLSYQPPVGSLPADDQDNLGYHIVTDFMTWTVVGIDSFSYSYFDTSPEANSPLRLSSLRPITPFPLVQSRPAYDPHTHTCSFAVSDFFNNEVDRSPMELWLGPLGPLATKIIQAGEFATQPPHLEPGFPNIATGTKAERTKIPSNPLITRQIKSSLISFELPSIEAILTISGLPLAGSRESPATAGTSGTSLLVPMSTQAVHRNVQALSEQLRARSVSEAAEVSNASQTASLSRSAISLPFLFIRKDGIGYQSERSIVLEPNPYAASRADAWSISFT
ncbi:hypothetical protein MVLG_02713 [Microbotryum lychnidis-dioicae p1A1 Lamole]|uniref:Uncharacterized protein n=1 Tax=Microbotryum lychnidis-dioicae (strain p1A1 Lamole / MvSl-1064) TaxID=683840 RepID=U5H606_USTV1|nr:hypothetical protein MVLG_02713 [Microbotryum lychnidis-dioicae p1A1 Lamole]|eukprot:KDE06975.1 hypothetical protein MVLG_02713 [Microbotryum lychnidis-dioicae p1A1 Lamole]